MDSVHICGGNHLLGELRIQGSKNASLPILAACILIDGISVIENCPDITDVSYMLKLLESIGCRVTVEGKTVTVDARNINSAILPSEYVTVMRSSVVLMGPLLARTGNALLDYPGGCVIGERPIDLHIRGFCRLGAVITECGETICGKANCLMGNEIVLDFPSVGASENIIMASVCAKGCTVLKNYAKEPEVYALCQFLNKAGADIRGFGSDRLMIEGGKKLSPVCFKIPSDRIVAGTYLLGCQSAGGNIRLTKAPVEDMQYLLTMLRKMGSQIDVENDIICMKTEKRSKAIPYIQTQVFPGFPTDLQSPLIVALSLADGESILEETIFESRFKIAEQLKKMGADILIRENKALLRGVKELNAQAVLAEELRGGAALVIAGLCANGSTTVSNKHFIERGYENIVKDLQTLGADIR